MKHKRYISSFMVIALLCNSILMYSYTNKVLENQDQNISQYSDKRVKLYKEQIAKDFNKWERYRYYMWILAGTASAFTLHKYANSNNLKRYSPINIYLGDNNIRDEFNNNDSHDKKPKEKHNAENEQNNIDKESILRNSNLLLQYAAELSRQDNDRQRLQDELQNNNQSSFLLNGAKSIFNSGIGLSTNIAKGLVRSWYSSVLSSLIISKLPKFNHIFQAKKNILWYTRNRTAYGQVYQSKNIPKAPTNDATVKFIGDIATNIYYTLVESPNTGKGVNCFTNLFRIIDDIYTEFDEYDQEIKLRSIEEQKYNLNNKVNIQRLCLLTSFIIDNIEKINGYISYKTSNMYVKYKSIDINNSNKRLALSLCKQALYISKDIKKTADQLRQLMVKFIDKDNNQGISMSYKSSKVSFEYIEQSLNNSILAFYAKEVNFQRL